jgi:putative flavoprotein involved in K+ transport
MATRIRTLVIGAGQAGLAISRVLTALGHEHLVLDRGRVAQRWRTERWDSFRLLTPNWLTRLPGYRYRGPDPDGFMSGADVVRFFEGYAGSFGAPVRTGVSVTSVRRSGSHWLVQTDAGRIVADSVVVATGHHADTALPAVAAQVPATVTQLHTRRYRTPDRLPPGAVLVVGAGPSGQQVASELARAGRTVFLAVGRHRAMPRRYRGRDVYWWLDRAGVLDATAGSVSHRARQAPNGVLAGGRDLDLRRLVADGVIPTGRVRAVEGHRVRLADDLPQRLAEADQSALDLRAAIDAFATANGYDAPRSRPAPNGPAPWAERAPRSLYLRGDDIGTVVWATGFRRDYSWLHAPVFDARGEPVHRRGVSSAPGLFFLGLRWLHRRNSHTIDGVGADAAYLAGRITGVSQRLTDVA